jgi:hypothetical protein
VVKQWMLVAIGSLFLVSCGKVPVLESPPDGATYNLNQYQTILVTVVDQNYSGVTIRVKGTLPSQVQCSGGNETYMTCTVGIQGAAGGTYQNSYTVVFEASKGDASTNHVVTFTSGVTP